MCLFQNNMLLAKFCSRIKLPTFFSMERIRTPTRLHGRPRVHSGLVIFAVEMNNILFLLINQCHICWCLNNAKNHGFSSNKNTLHPTKIKMQRYIFFNALQPEGPRWFSMTLLCNKSWLLLTNTSSLVMWLRPTLTRFRGCPTQPAGYVVLTH